MFLSIELSSTPLEPVCLLLWLGRATRGSPGVYRFVLITSTDVSGPSVNGIIVLGPFLAKAPTAAPGQFSLLLWVVRREAKVRKWRWRKAVASAVVAPPIDAIWVGRHLDLSPFPPLTVVMLTFDDGQV